MKTKICSKCGTEYPATTEYFYKKKRVKDGLAYVCIQCKKKYLKIYREENKEKHKETGKIYRAENKDKIKARRKIYQKENREKFRKQRAKVARKYYKTHEECREYIKNRMKDHTTEITPYYISLLFSVKMEELTPEIIETKRLIIQLKRELKANNIKIK